MAVMVNSWRDGSSCSVTLCDCGTVLYNSESAVSAIYKMEVVTLISSMRVKPHVKLLASEIQT
jgi:hypothetical protein